MAETTLTDVSGAGTESDVATINATLRDSDGDPLSGESVTFFLTVGNATTNEGDATTDAFGVATLANVSLLNVPPGVYVDAVEVEFFGNGDNEASSGVGDLTVVAEQPQPDEEEVPDETVPSDSFDDSEFEIAEDPFAEELRAPGTPGSTNPFEGGETVDPFTGTLARDPFGQGQCENPYTANQSVNPFTQARNLDPYAFGQCVNPFAASQSVDAFSREGSNSLRSLQSTYDRQFQYAEVAPEQLSHQGDLGTMSEVQWTRLPDDPKVPPIQVEALTDATPEATVPQLGEAALFSQVPFAYESGKDALFQSVSYHDTGNAALNLITNAWLGLYNISTLPFNLITEADAAFEQGLLALGASRADIEALRLLPVALPSELSMAARATKTIVGEIRAAVSAATDITPVTAAQYLEKFPFANEARTIEQAMSAPEAGTKILTGKIKDAAYQGEGWVKMSQQGEGFQVHYFLNEISGATDQWKTTNYNKGMRNLYELWDPKDP